MPPAPNYTIYKIRFHKGETKAEKASIQSRGEKESIYVVLGAGTP